MIVAPFSDETGRLQGILLGGVTTLKKDYFNDITIDLIPSFTVFSQQMISLIQNLESKRLLDQNPIHIIEEGRWLVAGVTSLRRLSRFLDMDLPHSRSVTIGGVVQETLRRLVRDSDEGDWGPFHFRVLEAPQRGHMLIELTIVSGEEAVS